jgi:hypothetical protein
MKKMVERGTHTHTQRERERERERERGRRWNGFSISIFVI